MRILIVDDEQTALRTVTRILKRHGLGNVDVCPCGGEAINLIKEKDYDVILLDLIMPDIDGLKVLETAKAFKPSSEFVVLTVMDDITTAVKAIRLGAYDYLVKPADHERLVLSIQRAYERKAFLAGFSGIRTDGRTEAEVAFSNIISQNTRMKELLSYACIMARSGRPLLITGESGTGKELFARGFHAAGPNPKGPFVAVNIASVPESIFEGEFFGYVKGAFTGAEKDHPGYFERANGGTLFLDEIGELPVRLQAKLLRVLEEKTLIRLGDTRSVHVSFGVVSATNRDLDAACREGGFRLDLLYRLKSAHIHLLPLRERRDDIPCLAGYFLENFRTLHRKDIRDFSPEAMEILIQRDYPGNVRELAQTVETAVLLCDSKLLQPKHFGEKNDIPALSIRTLCTLRENGERHLAFVLDITKGDTRQTAEILGVTVRQVQRKISQMRRNPRWTPLLDGLCKAGNRGR